VAFGVVGWLVRVFAVEAVDVVCDVGQTDLGGILAAGRENAVAWGSPVAKNWWPR
jgi:hypothetical protein